MSDLFDPIGGEPLRDMLGLFQQIKNREELEKNRQEMGKVADLLQRQERERKAQQKRQATLPQCPWCGGRLEGQFPICIHCRNNVSWVEGYPCQPGHEEELQDYFDQQRQRLAAAEAARVATERRNRQRELQEQRDREKQRQERWKRWKEEGSGTWIVPILWGLFIPVLLGGLIGFVGFLVSLGSPDVDSAVDPSAIAVDVPGDHAATAEEWARIGEEKLGDAKFGSAIVALEKAIELDPAKSDPSLSEWYFDRASAYEGTGNDGPRKAIEAYIQAQSQEKQKNWQQLIGCYKQSISQDPAFAWAYNNLAWALSTRVPKEQHDGLNPIDYATKACELSGWKCWSFVDTLSAAHQAEGHFGDALLYAERATRLCRKT